MALTESWLAKHYRQRQPRVIEKTDADGLSCRVTVTGRIIFQLRHRVDGKSKRVDLGQYPAMTLLDARNECHRMRQQLANGITPQQQPDTTANEPERVTVRSVLSEWHQRYATVHIKSHESVLASFENHIFPILGDLDYADVKPKAWFDLLEAIGQKVPQMAANLLVYLKLAQNWAQLRGIAPISPLANVKARHMGIVKINRKRTLNHDEIAMVLDSLRGSRMRRPFQILVELCLMLGCRSGELSGALKSHFDFDAGTWTIPPEFHKEGKYTERPIIRAIIPRAQELLEELFSYSEGSRWAIVKKGRDEPQGRAGLSNLTGSILVNVRNNYGVELEPFTLHDLRRTARTNWSLLTEPHVAETMLGHALPGMMKVYDQNHYLEAQAKAYEQWFDLVDEICNTSGDVIVVEGEM